MSSAKIRIKMGPIEIDFEGSEEFLKEELPSLLTAVSELHRNSESEEAGTDAQGSAGSGNPQPQGPGLSVTTIAAKLGVKTGPDLVIATAAKLTRAGVSSIPRQTLLEEMKQATGYYKTTHRSNLSNILISLVKEGKLQETQKDTYTLSAATKTEVEAKLGS
jgi:hypothetical protein